MIHYHADSIIKKKRKEYVTVNFNLKKNFWFEDMLNALLIVGSDTLIFK